MPVAPPATSAGSAWAGNTGSAPVGLQGLLPGGDLGSGDVHPHVGDGALGRVVAKLVYGVNPADPSTLFAVALILAAVAFFASVVPAYRATKVEPMTALHEE